MMNKLVILLLSACCLLMTACDKENDETAQGFRIMNADVDLAAGGGTVEVALQATGELTAVSGADWCINTVFSYQYKKDRNRSSETIRQMFNFSLINP